MSQEGIQHLTHKDFKCEDGTVLDLQTAYRTFGELEGDKKTVFVTTCFGGIINETLSLVGEGKCLDPANYFVVVIGLFGGSESSSPSNQAKPHDGPRFPKITYGDNIHCQRKLADHLGVKSLYAHVGFSMAGQISYHWAVIYPDFISKMVTLASSARTSNNNWIFLEGPKAALISSEGFNNGDYEKGEPRKGKLAWARVYFPWAYSEEWFKQEAWKSEHKTVEDYFAQSWANTVEEDANNLLCMANTWQSADISIHHPSKNFEKTLADMKPACLVMPASSDRYFTVGDSKYEIEHLPKHCKYAPIETIHGHVAGGGGGTEADNKFIDKEISEFLA